MAKYLRISGQVPVINPDTGDVELHPEAKAKRLIQQGWSPEGQQEYKQRITAEDNNHPVMAGITGGLRGLTLGASDMAFKAIGGQDYADELRILKESNPIASTIGELAGTGASFMIPASPLASMARGAELAGAKFGGKLTQALMRGGMEGAAMGAGQGISDYALDPNAQAENILTESMKGAVWGAGATMAAFGLGSLAKYSAKKISSYAEKLSGIGEGSKLSSKIETLKKEQDALYQLKNNAEQGIGEFGQKEAGQLEKLTGKINDLNTKIVDNTQSKLSGYLQSIVESKAERIAGATVGSLVGGWAGAVLGGLVAPAVLKGVKKAVIPAGKWAAEAAETASSTIGGLTQKPGIRATLGAAKAVPIHILSSDEFKEISGELNRTSPDMVDVQLQGNLPVGMTGRQKIIDYEKNRVAFLQEKMPKPVSINNGFEIPAGGEWHPSSIKRVKYGRYVRAAMNPYTVLDDFKRGQLTSEAVETMERLHPEDYDKLKKSVADEVRLHAARGERYSRDQEAQIALFLGQPSRGFQAISGVSFAPLVEPQQPPQRKKPPKNLDVQQLTTLQTLQRREQRI